MSNVTIADIVARHYADPATPPPESLVFALMEREEAMADMLRMAGVQFGLYPQVVAEVLAEIQMGTYATITVEQRQLIKAQFIALMDELQRQHGQS